MTDNVHILKGWSSIASLENVKPGMNIEDIENSLINGGLVQKTKDPQDKFNDELKDLANQFGISFGDPSTPKPTRTAIPPLPSTPIPAHMPAPMPTPTPSYQPPAADDEYYDDDDSEPVTSETFSRNDNDSELDYKTKEQERRSHISSVMRDIAPNNSFNFEEEKREDSKCAMLEEIDSLIYSLQDAEVDLSRIPKVDFKSSYADIEMVLKILRHKSDRTRYCTLAEEFFIWGAYGMEELFDGKRLWFNRYQPCLTGWHTQVQSKLRRMRHDTSQLVSEVMHDYNISPGMRVLLELIPNMFVYSSEKKKNQITASMYSDEDMAAANERLRQFN